MQSQQQENFLQNSVYKNYYNQLILDSFIQKIRCRQQGQNKVKLCVNKIRQFLTGGVS